MITARVSVDPKPVDKKEILGYAELVWKDDKVVDVFNCVELRIDMRPFYEGIAVSSGRKYVQSWSPVPEWAFLDIIGKYNRENKLMHIFLDDEEFDEQPN